MTMKTKKPIPESRNIKRSGLRRGWFSPAKTRITIIPHSAHFVKQKMQKSCTKFFPKICAFCTLHFAPSCSILIIVKGSGTQGESTGITRQIVKNLPLIKKIVDNLPKGCYNKYIKRLREVVDQKK